MESDTTVKHGRRSTSHLLIPSQTKSLRSQNERSHVDTNRVNLADNPTSTSILDSSLKTNTLYNATIDIRTSQVTSSRLRNIYSAVIAAYDTCILFMHHSRDYKEMRTGLMIELYRIYLWRCLVLAEDETEQGSSLTYDSGLWVLFECILTKMLKAFSDYDHTRESYEAYNSITRREGLSDISRFASLQSVEHNHEGSELLKSMSIFTKLPPKHSLVKLLKTVKISLLEKKQIERLLQTLCYWNNHLDGLTSTLERESSRRRLRAHFSTENIAELRNLKAAAAFLKHQDIERMANARSIIEQERHPFHPFQLQSPDDMPSTPPPEYRLKADELEWQEASYQTDQRRAIAIIRGESVIVDWQYCLDNSWGRKHPAEFRRRTQNLATILNTGLRPLNLSVLHWVGLLEKDSNITGYAFRLPPGADPGQMPVTLHHLLCNVKTAEDIPDLGERFQLAKALVSTVFEIHNLGGSHKNIQPKNILFWPKPNSKAKVDISKPYLVGFNILRPNQPGESSEKPLSPSGDDLYRHPLYKYAEPYSFRQSFDMYSLGVVLYEIGVWRCVTVASQAAPGLSRSSLAPSNSGSQDIDTLVKNGSISDLDRLMGKKYRDAVMACLKREFDDIWGKQEGKTYLDQVQSKIIDAIGVCSA